MRVSIKTTQATIKVKEFTLSEAEVSMIYSALVHYPHFDGSKRYKAIELANQIENELD